MSVSIGSGVSTGNIITAETNPVTGRIKFSPVNGQPLVQPSGMDYTSVLLPLNQSGGSSVLPTDYSGLSVPIAFGASAATPWANAGYFTSVAGAGNSSLIVPNSAVNLNLSTDSFIVAFTLNKATPAGTETVAGCADGSLLPGVNININASGQVGPRLWVNGAFVAVTYSTAVAANGSDHRVLVSWDAVSKAFTAYIDGVSALVQTATTVLATDIMTSPFALGRSATGNTVDGKFSGFEFARFTASGLPKNISELVTQDNARRISGISALPVFL